MNSKKSFKMWLVATVCLAVVVLCFGCFLGTIIAQRCSENQEQKEQLEKLEQKVDSLSNTIERLEKSNIGISTMPLACLEIDPCEVEKTKTIFKMVQISRYTVSFFEAKEIYEIIVEESLENNIDPKIMLSLAAVETQFKKDAVGDSGTSKGVFQIRNITVKDFYFKTGKKYSLDDMEDVRKNVEVAAWIYNFNVSNYGVDDNLQSRVIAYNTGNQKYKENKADLLEGKIGQKDYNYWTKFEQYYKIFSI